MFFCLFVCFCACTHESLYLHGNVFTKDHAYTRKCMYSLVCVCVQVFVCMHMHLWYTLVHSLYNCVT